MVIEVLATTIQASEKIEMGTEKKPRLLEVSIIYDRDVWGKVSVEELIQDYYSTARMAFAED